MKRASPLTRSRKGQRRFALAAIFFIAVMLALFLKELHLNTNSGTEDGEESAAAFAASANNAVSNGNAYVNMYDAANRRRSGDQRMVTKKAMPAPPTSMAKEKVPPGAYANIAAALQKRHDEANTAAGMAAEINNDAANMPMTSLKMAGPPIAVPEANDADAETIPPEPTAHAGASKKYRLARPLEGQVPSDEFFKPRSGYSNWWCGGPPGDVDVLGKRLDPRHYCVIRNMCIVGRTPTLFVESAGEVEGMRGSVRTYVGLPHCVFNKRSSFAIRAGDNGHFLERARQMGRFEGGLTAFVSSSYGQRHITHFMESLGQLFHGLNIFGLYQDHGEEGAYLSPPLSPDLTGAPDNLSNYHAFNRTPFALKHAELERVLVAGAGGVAEGSFNEQFYRMLFTNRRRPGGKSSSFGNSSDYRPRVIDSIDSHTDRCFDEAILIGASYDPFSKTHAPSYYRHRDWFYGLDRLSEDDQRAIADRLPGEVRPSAEAFAAIEAAQRAADDANAVPNNNSNNNSPAANGEERRRRPLRRVVMAHRSAKRTVTNARELDQWMASTLPTLLPQYEWRIRSVNFGALSNFERLHVAHWADIIIGMHGADLTNLINMRPGSAVVELNPLFFFETRFREMSHSLQLHYFAWTCTRPSCSTVWKKVVPSDGDFTYDAATGRLRLRDGIGAKFTGRRLEKFLVHEERHRSTGGWFKWPTDRYVGDECVGCGLLTCCTRMHGTLYSTQRESNVKFGSEEFAELFALLRRAAAAVGTPYIDVPRLSLAEQLAAAKAENVRNKSNDEEALLR